MGFSTELASEMVGIETKFITKYKKENEFKATAASRKVSMSLAIQLPPGDVNSPDNPANQPPTAREEKARHRGAANKGCRDLRM
jgi:hypothetical protein